MGSKIGNISNTSNISNNLNFASMEQNRTNGEQRGDARFSISTETANRIELLRDANRLFNRTYEAIRSGLPEKPGSDNTEEADAIFSRYFGEAQKITREAYQRYVADNIGDALLDDTSNEI